MSFKTTFDSYNFEFTTLHPNINLGVHSEVNKTLSKNLQVTTIINNYSRQYFVTLFGEMGKTQSIFQFGFEPNGSSSLRGSLAFNNAIAKYQSIYSKNMETFSQIEYIYNSKFFNLAVKLIKPAFKASNLIYIFNYWKDFGKICCGFEIVGLDNQLSIGLASRIEHGNSISCINLQRFNLLTISFYKKFFNKIDCGVEIKKSSEIKNITIGAKIKNKKTELKCTLENLSRVGFSWEEKLCENLSVGFCGTYDFEEFNYGVSLSYQD